jgi:outer membrane murein-binding lipoprotein Lpp
MRNRMHRRNCIVLLITILMILAGCADKAKVEFQKGKELQEQYEYEGAIVVYDSLVGKYPDSPWVDSAKQEVEVCKAVLQQIDDAFGESSSFIKKGKYDKADSKIQEILTLKVSESVKIQVEQYRKDIADAKEVARRSSFDYVIKTVVGRMNKGASSKTALGDLKGTKIKWTAIPGTICMGLSGTPVAFKKGKWEFFGVPSYGLDKLKFLMFCEANEGKTVLVEGTLLSASDWPGTPLWVEVNRISRK